LKAQHDQLQNPGHQASEANFGELFSGMFFFAGFDTTGHTMSWTL